MQAPQRAWVTASHVPSKRRISPSPPRDDLDTTPEHPELAIPRLLSILEPCLVWRHPATTNSAQAQHCARGFLDGKQRKRSLTVHGVYEGSYWRLLTDVTDLRGRLARLANPPDELPIPKLALPQEPEELLWEDYAPALQRVESTAPIPPLVLPAFQVPQLLVCFPPITYEFHVSVPDCLIFGPYVVGYPQ